MNDLRLFFKDKQNENKKEFEVVREDIRANEKKNLELKKVLDSKIDEKELSLREDIQSVKKDLDNVVETKKESIYKVVYELIPQ